MQIGNLYAETCRPLLSEIAKTNDSERLDKLQKHLTSVIEAIADATFPFKYTPKNEKNPFRVTGYSEDNIFIVLRKKDFPRLEPGSQNTLNHAFNLMTLERTIHKRAIVTEETRSEIEQEVEIYKALQGYQKFNQMLDFHYYDTHLEKTKRCMFVKWCDGGDLNSYLCTYNIDHKLVKSWMIQLCENLIELHSLNISHRDIKLENIFINDGKLVLGDFGAAMKIEPDSKIDFVSGTPHYMAPEIFADPKPYFESDVWALGILLHYILHEEPPSFSKYLEMIQDETIMSLESDLRKTVFASNMQLFINEVAAYRDNIPAKGTWDWVIYKMLDPNLTTRISLKNLKKLLESLIIA